jgi:hypothetical protein
MGKRTTLETKTIANGDSDDWSGSPVKVDKSTGQITIGLLATQACSWQAYGVMAGLDVSQAVALFTDETDAAEARVMAAGGLDAGTVECNFDRVYVSVTNASGAADGDFTPQFNEV